MPAAVFTDNFRHMVEARINIGVKKYKGGLFVSFEGGEGSGKSTQIQFLAETLRSKGYGVVLTREPGGTAGAEALRHVLLNARNIDYSPLWEAVLFAAGRRDHIEQVIAPALAADNIVLCDRFMDSTRVYQGLTNKIPRAYLNFLEEIAVEPYHPSLSIFLDIDAKTGMRRAAERRSPQQQADRFEKDNLRIQERRRRAFLDIADKEPQRCRVVDANRSREAIAADIWGIICGALNIAEDSAATGNISGALS